MKFKTAKELLGDCPIQIFSYDDPELDFRFMFDFKATLQYYPENILYYCDYTTLYNSPKASRKGDCLLLYLNEENIDPLSTADFTNVIATDDINLFNQIIFLLQNALTEESRLMTGNQELLNKIISNKPLQEIVNHISTTYGHYSDILDNAMNILVTSNNMTPPEVKAMGDDSYKAIQPNIIQYLRTKGFLDKMRRIRRPLYVEDEPRNVFVYSTPIFIGDVLNVGFFTLFVEQGEEFSPVTLHYLQETARLLSLLMQKDTVKSATKASYFTHLLSSMLQGTPATAASYKDRFMVFNYHMRKYKRIAVIKVQNNLPTNIDIDTLCDTLQPMFPNSVYVVFDMYIVFLMSENSISDIKNSSTLNEFLKQNLLKAGISAVYEDESNTGDHYETAKAALHLGERLEHESAIYLYDDFKIIDVIDSIAETKNLHLICFPPLIKLIQEDDAEKNALVQTLFVYLNSQFSAQKTCDALFIHRNTLYYRLQKIKEIMGCDFMEYSNLVEIGVTFQILKYLNLVPAGVTVS